MAVKAITSRVVALPEAPPARVQGQRIGLLVAWVEGEGLWVDYPDNPLGPQLARSTIVLSEQEVTQAMEMQREVLLSFDAERADRPIVVGLLQPAHLAPGESKDASRSLLAEVDGQRVRLRAEDEIVLACGKASITLRRNGRVVIRGAYVETRSEGVNRIKGGSVKIN